MSVRWIALLLVAVVGVFAAGGSTPASAGAEAPSIVWSGTLSETLTWEAFDTNESCVGSSKHSITLSWRIPGETAVPTNERPTAPGIAGEYRVEPTGSSGSGSGFFACGPPHYVCPTTDFTVTGGSARTVGVVWPTELTYDASAHKLAIAPLPGDGYTESTIGEFFHQAPSECGGDDTSSISVDGIGMPVRLLNAPWDDSGPHDYRLPVLRKDDGTLAVEGAIETKDIHHYLSAGGADGFGFNSFANGGFFHGSCYPGNETECIEILISHIDANLHGACQNAGDAICTPSVREQEQKPQCSDGLDNDQDGRADFPADPGCTGPTDFSELDPTCTEPAMNVTFAIYRGMDRPRTNGCWTFDRPKAGGGSYGGRWKGDRWTTCRNESLYRPARPTRPAAPGYWAYDDAAGFLDSPQLTSEVRDCANRAARWAGGSSGAKTIGYMYTAYRKGGRGRSLVPTAHELKVFRNRVAEQVTFFFQLYDWQDFGCPPYQRGCGHTPVDNPQLESAWSPGSGLVGMLDLTTASPDLIREKVLALCRESRSLQRISIYAGENGPSNVVLQGARMNAVKQAMDACTPKA